jgi:hypothetical protein
MNTKELFEIIIGLVAGRVQQDEIREEEIGLCHARINFLVSTLTNVVAAVEANCQNEVVAEMLNLINEGLQDNTFSVAHKRITARAGFSRDQMNSEIERIKMVIDQLPSE